MSGFERTYSVIVVSASEKVNQALAECLSGPSFSPVRFVADIGSVKRALVERAYDFVIVNSPLPDDPGIRFAVDASEAEGTVVLFMARAEMYEDVFERLVGRGVFVFQKPISRSAFEMAVGWLMSAREKIRKTEIRTLSFEEKMNEIRLVNRAKWLLISHLQMTEPDAHRYIEKQAMDRCISKKTVAEEIIRTYT
ncbi:MAG: ANTAR domain-containing protein [Clostridia bacterium]|nr:ANTAR domain-containing protein [Clostridia bacterium]